MTEIDESSILCNALKVKRNIDGSDNLVTEEKRVEQYIKGGTDMQNIHNTQL